MHLLPFGPCPSDEPQPVLTVKPSHHTADLHRKSRRATIQTLLHFLNGLIYTNSCMAWPLAHFHTTLEPKSVARVGGRR